MDVDAEFAAFEVGFDIPAKPGMSEADIQTPCLVLDLDALERNIVRMGAFTKAHGMRHRAHGKMHKSLDVARLQMRLGGAVGICCQKVSEAEVFARGGIADILLTNEVRDPVKIDRLARLPRYGAAVTVCVDDLANVPELAAAARRHGTTLGCLVEIDCGAGRCGVLEPLDAVALARAIDAAEGLTFEGLQAYQGALQHLPTLAERQAAFDKALLHVRATLDALRTAGLEPALVSGGGTGSYAFEAASGVYNELQCGSYTFMDAAYGRVLKAGDGSAGGAAFENAFFLLTSVMSHAKADVAVCDAGLKVQSVDSGLPVVFGRPDLAYVSCSDEHGVILDPNGALSPNDRLRLVPGHCDPTCNLHDWYVGVRAGRVETVWPVSARGKAF